MALTLQPQNASLMFTLVGDGSSTAITVDPTSQLQALFGTTQSFTLNSATYQASSSVPGLVAISGTQLVITLTSALGNGATATIALEATVTFSGPALAGANATYNSAAPVPTVGFPVAAQADGYGNRFVAPYRRSQTVPAPGNIASATPATLVAAQGVGIFADLSVLVLTMREGTTANIFFAVLISDGTNSYRFNFMSQDVTTFQPTAGLSMTFNPPLKAANANTAWTIALSSATDAPSVDYVANFVLQKAS